MTDWNLFYSALTAFATILALITGLLTYFTKLIVRSALAEFRIDLLNQMDGRFLSTTLADTIFKRGDDRWSLLKDRVDELYRMVERTREL